VDIAIIGSGYVGLVTGACFAHMGNNVICVDNDEKKIRGLKKGNMPIYEPGLAEMVKENIAKARLSFSNDIRSATRKSKVIFIAVSTPPRENGEADLTAIEDVTRQVAKALEPDVYRLIVEKSTVPIETGKWIEYTLELFKQKEAKFDVACNPEFLREGSAIKDFLNPDRIVIGVSSERAEDMLRELYQPIKAPVVVTDVKSAELIKHASNSFLAAKVSFINAIANICDASGADVLKVAEGMGLDRRIGSSFLNAGIGFGGFCFPKDLTAFITIAKKLGYDFDLLKEVERINENQKKAVLDKISKSLWNLQGKTIAILGLSFKPDTDDIRFSPSIDIIQRLEKEGAEVKAYDPHAMEKARAVLKKVKFCRDPYEAAKDADCLLVATEWSEFKEMDLRRVKKLMRQPILLDGRNIYDPAAMKKMGFKYMGMGRG
jgi:UDPglucose 6-dehydrogenase